PFMLLLGPVTAKSRLALTWRWRIAALHTRLQLCFSRHVTTSFLCIGKRSKLSSVLTFHTGKLSRSERVQSGLDSCFRLHGCALLSLGVNVVTSHTRPKWLKEAGLFCTCAIYTADRASL